MLQKSLYTSLLTLCEKHHIQQKHYVPGDIVLDHETSHTLYLFESGWYTAWIKSPFSTLHAVGEIDAPSTLGEGVFFGSFQKPIRIIAESPGSAYLLDEKSISHMTGLYPHFREMLMRACLATTNDRIREANIERTLDYALSDTIESDTTRSIPKLLDTLKHIFALSDVIWIERHNILEDVYAIRYRASLGAIPVNERIDMAGYDHEGYSVETGFLGMSHAHIFPLRSRGETYGYIVYSHDTPRLKGYIQRITTDIIPNCIRVIEENWKR